MTSQKILLHPVVKPYGANPCYHCCYFYGNYQMIYNLMRQDSRSIFINECPDLLVECPTGRLPDYLAAVSKI